ncbi:MAG: transposase [Clostridia bacterium]
MQSGKAINIYGTISKRGNKYARWILFNCIQMIIKLEDRQYPEHLGYIYYQSKNQKENTIMKA